MQKNTKKKLAKVFWAFQKWTKINVQKRFIKKWLATNFKKKRLCYEMKETFKQKGKKRPHKHLFVRGPTSAAFFDGTRF